MRHSCLHLLAVLCALPALAADVVLPPEAQREKARLEFLFQTVAKRYPCEIRDQVNEMLPRLHSLTFAEGVGKVDGKKRIEIPADLVRVWPLFDSLAIYGKGLGEGPTKVTFVSPIGTHDFHFWTRKGEFISGHANRLPRSDDKLTGYAILYEGKGTIEHLVLRKNHGISSQFDDGPWSTLGKDKPIRTVVVQADPTRQRSIGGQVRLPRERFWRLPTSYGLHPGSVVGSKYCMERGFTHGRGIRKLDGLQRWGFQGRKLREDPANPGKPDYRIFDQTTPDPDTRKQLDAIFGTDFQYADCFDNWPDFMALKNTRAPNQRGTPANYRDAAELAARYITAEKRMLGKTARWWEVKNESTVTTEWVLHAEPGVDSWGELATFHNAMADAIHRDHQDVLVGGPTSAWMALHHGDFDLARKQLRFMDETKGKLDFYSHHFYEGKSLILADGDTYSGGYLMGRLEGCLDLLRNHMVLTDNVRPFVISETGTLYGRNTEFGIWLNTKNLSSYLLRYLQHAESIDLVSLWLIPVVHWDKRSKTLFEYGPDNQLILREKVGYFLELWKDFRGDQIPVRLAKRDTFTHLHAVREGRTVRIAVNNLNPYRIAVDLDLDLDAAKIERIEQTRLYFDQGEIHFRTETRDSLSGLPVAVEETSMVTITLDRDVPIREVLAEKTFYGDKYLQPTGKAVPFVIACPTANLRTARLRLCLSRDGGFGQPMTVRVNGHLATKKPMVITPVRKPGNYWGYVELDVPTAWLQAQNTVTVAIPEEKGYITSAVLVNQYAERP